MSLDHHFAEPTAIRSNLGAIFVSLELSRSTWLITSLSPGGGEKMSKHGLSAGNIAALLARLSELKQNAFARTGQSFQVIVIQEAGLDGFWIHRVLQSEGVESHVVDAASIATSRRRRRPKADRIDGETLVRTLMAFKRGEPRVCSMARDPQSEWLGPEPVVALPDVGRMAGVIPPKFDCEGLRPPGPSRGGFFVSGTVSR